jgi:Tol biopolymer transport system component/plastocyanin
MIEGSAATRLIRVHRRAVGAVFVGALAVVLSFFAVVPVGAGPARPLLSGETEPNQATTEIAVLDNRFDPTTVTVTVGSIVRWTNRGANLHSTTSDAGHWDWTLVPGASFSARFLAVGVYGYYCKYHRAMGMTGRVVVLRDLPPASGTVPPSSTPGPSPTPGPTALPGGDDIVFDYFATEVDSASRTDLFVVAADGSGKRQLTNTATMSEAQPSWSPERRRVAYTVTQGDPAVGPWQLAVLNLDSGQSRAITAGREHYEPDWRPDGSLIAFTSLTRSGQVVVSSELAVVAPDGSGYRVLLRLNSTYYSVGNPAWSPDGQQIAFTLESGTAGGELYVMDIATGTARKLLDHPGWDDIDPAWSPDGRYIAFASGVARGSVTATYHTIWVLNRTTGAAGAIVTVPEWDLRGPSWSPGGLEIVFSARFQVTPARWALYVVPATGGAVRGALSVGVEPDWGSGTLLPLPTPVPGATITPITPPPPPTFPPPPTELPPPITPGPSPTAPLPPTFPPPTAVTVEPTATAATVEPTATHTATLEPTPTATATMVEATPSPSATTVERHDIYLPRVDDKIGT